MNRLKFLRLWSLAVGSMDACTGLMLVFAPAQTLRLMHVPEVAPAALIFLSWMRESEKMAISLEESTNEKQISRIQMSTVAIKLRVLK